MKTQRQRAVVSAVGTIVLFAVAAVCLHLASPMVAVIVLLGNLPLVGIAIGRPSDDDERSRQIDLRATRQAAATGVTFALIVGAVRWFSAHARGHECCEIDVLPLMGAAACVVFLVLRAVWVVQYQDQDLDVTDP